MIFLKKSYELLLKSLKFITAVYEKIESAVIEFYKKYCAALIERLADKVNGFQVKYLKKGQLKNYLLIRYLVKELLLYFTIAFLFFFMIFFVNQILLLAEDILKKRVPVADVVRLIVYSLPAIIAQSAPFATLVGFLMCLGRIMTENEVLILRASGQNYAVFVIPVLILGLGISVISFFVNDYLLPVSMINYNKLSREIIRSNPAVEIEAHSIKHLNDATIVIGDVNDGIVSDIVFFDRSGRNKERIVIAGKSSLASAKKDGVLMQLNMENSIVAFIDTVKSNSFDILSASNAALNIFDSSVFGGSFATSPREMTFYDLGRKIREMKQTQNYTEQMLNRYIMEYNKKFSLPFGSIFFAFLALPLAFIFGKHNGQTIGLIVGLFICLIYWAMMILGQLFAARNGLDGFWAMWFPNILIGGAGGLFYFLLKRR